MDEPRWGSFRVEGVKALQRCCCGPGCLLLAQGFFILVLTIHHSFSVGFRSGELAGQSTTVISWSANQLVVVLLL